MKFIIRHQSAALNDGSPTSVPDRSAFAPETLDGAQVVSTAPATPNQIGTDYETGEAVVTSYFAIAHYPKSPRSFYLFGVSAAHDVMSDFVFRSAEDAVESALASGFVTREFKSRNG